MHSRNTVETPSQPTEIHSVSATPSLAATGPATADGVHGGHRGLDGFGFGQEVAGDDRDIRGRQGGEERGFARVASHEVQVRQVEHGERAGRGRR